MENQVVVGIFSAEAENCSQIIVCLIFNSFNRLLWDEQKQ